MKPLYRILPLAACIVLAVSVAASHSMAFAVEAGQASVDKSGAALYAESDTDESGSPEEPSASTGMFDTTAALGKALIDGIWSLFGIYVPGFSFTFAQMWLGVLLCSVSILVIRMIFGFGGGPRGESPRTSSTNNPRISKERRHDEL